ncbi:hypothetical protein PRIPAC_92253 [Pristionchus pacificus]|uniref:Uncharacterized protein n=1 Tax=Pristionchus pacificus TaxID=54126 RepID=A0A2A6BNZ1_PRIPA|nr:hypothetical protein PRIPAC_92253 [Pristionchus pacificus]|eukprot:PDM67619.1 hypothetical protein PRIPAC_45663 [Pristionchus pacificus]
MAKRSLDAQEISNSKRERAEEHSLDIASLPSDVIRHIIRTGNESFNSMMLISKRWKALALDHLQNRKLLPVIRSLDWSLSTKDPIIFNIPEHLANFYWIKHLPIVRKMIRFRSQLSNRPGL